MLGFLFERTFYYSCTRIRADFRTPANEVPPTVELQVIKRDGMNNSLKFFVCDGICFILGDPGHSVGQNVTTLYARAQFCIKM